MSDNDCALNIKGIIVNIVKMSFFMIYCFCVYRLPPLLLMLPLPIDEPPTGEPPIRAPPTVFVPPLLTVPELGLDTFVLPEFLMPLPWLMPPLFLMLTLPLFLMAPLFWLLFDGLTLCGLLY